MDIFPDNTKAGKRVSKGQYLLLIVGCWSKWVASSYYWLLILCSVIFSVGLPTKKKTTPGFGKYCVPLALYPEHLWSCFKK
jgi:hypothetical protein